MPFDIEAARATLGEVRRHDAADLRDRIAHFAAPRMSGTDGAAEAESKLREAFEALGYETRELPFTFSTWPGRFGLPVAGILFALTGAAAATLVSLDHPILALVALVVGAVLSVLPLALLGRALRAVPYGRLDTRNLLFTRPGSEPAWLVMAHRDTKSQLMPSLVRTGAIVVGVVAWIGLVVLASLWLAGEPYRFMGAAHGAAGVMALVGMVLALSWAANESPGALDNATGLAALLAVAESTENGAVGFLVTDGEEMGLAGARAAVSAIPPVEGIVNVDGLDDRGSIRIAEGHGWRRRGSAPQLAAALLTAGQTLEIEVRRRRLPRALIVDHLPFADAGIPALTVIRGQWGSLLRVHRPGDSADRLQGGGAAESATLLTAALRLLGARREEHLAGGRGARS